MAKDIKCPRCENKMIQMQPCHMLCPNCGAHLETENSNREEDLQEESQNQGTPSM